MAKPLEHVEYLSKEIGARPAGTEEEQNAALYIADQLQKTTGFHAEIEEFTGTSNFPYVKPICCAVIVVVAVLAMAAPLLAIPALLLAVIFAAIFALESLDRPVVTRAFAKSASQNIVAKYQPGSKTSSGRSSKIVLVAHYDSGKVSSPFLEKLENLRIPTQLVVVCAAILSAVLLLIRVFLGSVGGVALIALNVLTVLAFIPLLLPIVKAVLVQRAPYNEGANNNATGVAALIEVARRISHGSVSEADLAADAEGVAIHGEAAAIAQGLVPEGAEIRYEAERLTPPEMEPLDDEERLLAAKAAIAAMTGVPVERRVYGSVASKLVNSRATGSYDDDAAFGGRTGSSVDAQDVLATSAVDDRAEVPTYSMGGAAGLDRIFEQTPPRGVQSASQRQPETEDPQAVNENGASSVTAVEPGNATFENAPNWFVAAQQKAKKNDRPAIIQRSRYTEAIEAAEREMEERERARKEEEQARAEEERRAREQATRDAIAAAQAAAKASGKQEGDQGGLVETPALDVAAEGREASTNVAAPVDLGQTMAVAPISMAEIAQELAAQENGEDETSVQAGEIAPSRRRIATLPAIEAQSPKRKESTSPSRSGMFRKLRADVPSLSGVIRMKNAGEDVSQVPAGKRGDQVAPARSVPQPAGLADATVDYDMQVPYMGANEQGPSNDGSRSWNGGAFSRMRLGHVDTKSGEGSVADEPIEDRLEEEPASQLTGEIEKIYHFRNPRYNTEIWFVAIGSDGGGHDGALAFLNAHQAELRGAMIVEVESLGAGRLSVATEEGGLLKVAASSRIKRFTRKAQSATGITLASVSLAGSDSITSTLQKAGYQAMHLFGEESGKPALKGSADDVLENIDEELLDDNVNFLMELLKR